MYIYIYKYITIGIVKLCVYRINDITKITTS